MKDKKETTTTRRGKEALVALEKYALLMIKAKARSLTEHDLYTTAPQMLGTMHPNLDWDERSKMARLYSRGLNEAEELGFAERGYGSPTRWKATTPKVKKAMEAKLKVMEARDEKMKRLVNKARFKGIHGPTYGNKIELTYSAFEKLCKKAGIGIA